LQKILVPAQLPRTLDAVATELASDVDLSSDLCAQTIAADSTATSDELTPHSAMQPAKPPKRPDPTSPPSPGFQLRNPPNTPQLGLTFAAPAPTPPPAPKFRLNSESSQVGLGLASRPTPSTTAQPPLAVTPPPPEDPPLIRALSERGGWSARPDVLAILRAILEATAPRSKEELVTAAAIDAKSWPSIIKLLVENGLVVSQGKLRATRYSLVPQSQ